METGILVGQGNLVVAVLGQSMYLYDRELGMLVDQRQLDDEDSALIEAIEWLKEVA